jgi:hypothetical protein
VQNSLSVRVFFSTTVVGGGTAPEFAAAPLILMGWFAAGRQFAAIASGFVRSRFTISLFSADT